MCILPYTTGQWLRFFDAIGHPELANNPDYASPAGRSRNFDTLYAIIEAEAARRTNAEWTALLIENDILFGEANTIEQIFDDPHLVSRDMFPVHAHPTEGNLRMIGFPINSTHTATRLRLLPPRLGEHGIEIARSLGYDDAHINAMIASGALRVPG